MSAVSLKAEVLAMLLLATSAGAMASTTTSHDAYARIDEQTGTLVIGTTNVEEKVQLTHGDYLLKSFQNRITHREYMADGSLSDEFRVTVNGKTVTGAGGGWTWVGAAAKILTQGEIEATVRLQKPASGGGKALCGISQHQHHPPVGGLQEPK